MGWRRRLACITDSVDEELLLGNDVLVKETRILRSTTGRRVKLTDAERIRLAEKGKQHGRQALGEIATIVNPNTEFMKRVARNGTMVDWGLLRS